MYQIELVYSEIYNRVLCMIFIKMGFKIPIYKFMKNNFKLEKGFVLICWLFIINESYFRFLNKCLFNLKFK